MGLLFYLIILFVFGLFVGALARLLLPGRDPMSIGLAYRCAKHGKGLPMTAGDGERHLFSGSSADIAGDLRDLRDLGVTHVDFGFAGSAAAVRKSS